MEWSKELPKFPGKYVVETKTMMNNTKRLEAFFTGSGMFVPALGDYVYQDDNWRGRYIYE